MTLIAKAVTCLRMSRSRVIVRFDVKYITHTRALRARAKRAQETSHAIDRGCDRSIHVASVWRDRDGKHDMGIYEGGGNGVNMKGGRGRERLLLLSYVSSKSSLIRCGGAWSHLDMVVCLYLFESMRYGSRRLISLFSNLVSLSWAGQVPASGCRHLSPLGLRGKSG